MRLKEYFELTKEKPYKWADANGINRSRVYAWLSGQKPGIDFILKVKAATSGAVGPEDWQNGSV